MLRILVALLPGLLLLAGALALASSGLKGAIASAYPWVVYPSALFLGAYFHRSRAVVGVLALAATAWVAETRAGGFTAFYLAGGLAALTLGALALSKDRGVLSLGGLLHLGAFLLLGSFGALLLAVAPTDMAQLLAAMPLSPSWSIWSGFPQPVLLGFVVAGPLALGSAVVRRGPVDRGLCWALAFLALALYLSTDPRAVAILLMAGGLALTLSVVETSYAMAFRDDLTGLPARRALNREMEGLSGAYAVAMVDVDHFKSFNDRYGHDVGDQVLRMVAGRLLKAPGGGRAFRYGGEEFTLLFPGKTRQEVALHLEALREEVERSTFILRSWRRPRKKPVNPGAWKSTHSPGSKSLSVTVSIGVADSGGRDPSPAAVLKQADEALYRAKKAGRNRVAR